MNITPDEIIDFSSNPEIKKRDPKNIEMDILRAKAKISGIFKNSNKNYDTIVEKNPNSKELRLAHILYAEYYGLQSLVISKADIQSETYDDYSYTRRTDKAVIEPDIMPLIKPFLEDDSPSIRTTTMRLRVL